MTRRASDLIVFVAKRLAQLLPVLFGVIAITFFFSRISIKNPCSAWLGPHASKTAVKGCIDYFGTNLPLWQQFERYLVGLLSGNWGADPASAQPVLPQILSAFPETLELVLASLAIMVILGIPLGVVAAGARGRWIDHLVRLFYLSGWATPTYAIALILAIVVAPSLGLSTGDFTSTPNFPEPTHMSVLDALLAGNLPATGDALAHLALPAFALAFLNMGLVTRMTRTSMLESLPMDFVRTARMKGLSEFFVLFKHALRNSLITTTTVLGLTAGYLLAATVVVEEIFVWPGIGEYAFNAIQSYNFAGTIGVVIFFAVGVVISNLISDVVYGIVDPQVEWR